MVIKCLSIGSHTGILGHVLLLIVDIRFISHMYIYEGIADKDHPKQLPGGLANNNNLTSVCESEALDKITIFFICIPSMYG